jgi:NAD(P)-dependent dehydrogenase (short-subunit alcohol dehydrogenase family)
MKKLEEKIAVITGGNSGIGLATAQRFVDEGAYVFMVEAKARLMQQSNRSARM